MLLWFSFWWILHAPQSKKTWIGPKKLLCLGAALAGQELTSSSSISQEATNHSAGRCQLRSSGHSRPFWPGRAGADCCWLRWHWGDTGSIPIFQGRESHLRHSSDPPGCAHLCTPGSWALPLCLPVSVHWRQQGWGLNCMVGAVLWTRTLGSSSQAIQHSPEPINNAWIPHMELTPASHSSECQQILLFSFLLCICGVMGGSGRRESSSEVLCWSAFTSSSSFFFHSLPSQKAPAWALSEQQHCWVPWRPGVAAGSGKQMGLMCSAKRRL